MNFFKEFFKAINNAIKGLSLIFEKRLWLYLFYPLIVWLLIWGLSIYAFASLAEHISEILKEKLSITDIPESGSWLSFTKPFLTSYFSFIIAGILKVLLWFISSTFLKYVTLIFLSPLFAILSEKMDEQITGKVFSFNGIQLCKDIMRGIAMSIRNMMMEYFFIATCFIITLLFPPLAIITAPFLLLTSWYFIGFTMLDYNFERYKMTISQSVQFMRTHKGLACGIGAVFSFFMLLPAFVGIMFGSVLAVTAATICYIEMTQNNHSSLRLV